MESNWHYALDDISGTLMAMDTRTDDGPMLIEQLLRLIEVLHKIGDETVEAPGVPG